MLEMRTRCTPDRKVEIAPAARRDLDDILDFSTDAWGWEQAFLYIDTLYEAFYRLRTFPGLGIDRSRQSEGLRSFVVGEQMVFYRVFPTLIRVTRVLHVREDADAALRRDDD